MNDQEFYKLQTFLKAARDRLDSLKAEKLALRRDRWELSDFVLFKQFDKLTEEIKEFEEAYFKYQRDRLSGWRLLTEIADCQNVLDGIAYLILKEIGETQ